MGDQDIINTYIRWKDNALARYPIPGRFKQKEKERYVAEVFWFFFWRVVLDFPGNRSIDDMRVIIARGLGEEEASNIDNVRKFWNDN